MAESYVHTGFWINHSKGHVLGATLTVPPRDGALLVSFLALYVRLVGNQLWSLLCFVIHQIRSTRKPKDGLHHQQQVLLRNSASQNHTLLELLKLSWFWKNSTNKVVQRCLPLATLAILHSCTFALAGLFAYRATFSTADEVLVRSPSCGSFKFPLVAFESWNEETFDLGNAAEINKRTTSMWSSNYARSCYVNGSTPGCNVFTGQIFGSDPDYSVKCPFADGVCVDDSEGVIRLDSGPIFSDSDLGINTRREDAIIYRRTMTCAPIHTRGFASDPMPGGKDDVPGDEFYYYYYGDSVLNHTITSNYTYAYDDYRGRTTDEPYKLSAEIATLHDTQNGFIPVKEINTTDSDLVLVFMESSATYTRPVTDLYFDAEKKIESVSGIGDHVYLQNWAVSVMGCTEQHQFCNPAISTSDGCSPMTGVTEVGRISRDIQFNAKQSQVYDRIWSVVDSYGLWDHISELGSGALLARDYLLSGNSLLSAPLPSDQWVQEVTGWHRAILTMVQRLIVDFARGPSERAYNSPKYLMAPSPEAEWMCKSQKVRGTEFYNFTIAGLVLILVPGSLVVLANQIIPSIVGPLQRLIGKGKFRRQEWLLTDKLQLQRMAYEYAGIGSWKGKDNAVPVTANYETFGLPCDSVPIVTYSRPGSYSPLPQQQVFSSQTYYIDPSKEQRRLSVTNLP